MIGFIALAGIEVRNSILLVDFAKNGAHRGVSVAEAVITAGKTRMRPIWATVLTIRAVARRMGPGCRTIGRWWQ